MTAPVIIAAMLMGQHDFMGMDTQYISHDFSTQKQHAVVIDGDTFRIGEQRYRLYGIDCPEEDQPHGAAATAYARRMFEKFPAQVVTRGSGAWGRINADVYMDGGRYWLNAGLVRWGHAWYDARYRNSRALQNFHNSARREQRGMWGLARPAIAPWLWRRGVRVARGSQLGTPLRSPAAATTYLPRINPVGARSGAFGCAT